MYVVQFKGAKARSRGTVWEGLPRRWGSTFRCAATDCRCIINPREGKKYRFWHHKCTVSPQRAHRMILFLTKLMATARWVAVRPFQWPLKMQPTIILTLDETPARMQGGRQGVPRVQDSSMSTSKIVPPDPAGRNHQPKRDGEILLSWALCHQMQHHALCENDETGRTAAQPLGASRVDRLLGPNQEPPGCVIQVLSLRCATHGKLEHKVPDVSRRHLTPPRAAGAYSGLGVRVTHLNGPASEAGPVFIMPRVARRPTDMIAPLTCPTVKYSPAMCTDCQYNIILPIVLPISVSKSSVFRGVSPGHRANLLCARQSCIKCGQTVKRLILSHENESKNLASHRHRVFNVNGTVVAVMKAASVSFSATEQFDYIYEFPSRRELFFQRVKGTIEDCEKCHRCAPIVPGPLSAHINDEEEDDDQVNPLDTVDIDPDERKTCSLCDIATSSAIECSIIPSARMMKIMSRRAAPFFFCTDCLVTCDDCLKPSCALIDAKGSYCDQCYSFR